MVCLQNKKQRMMVRHAVLKGKDPSKLLEEMEIIDKIGRFYYAVNNNNNKIQNFSSAIFTECSMALYITRF